MQAPYNPLLLDHAHRHLDELHAEAARRALLRQARSSREAAPSLLQWWRDWCAARRQTPTPIPWQRSV